MTETGKPLVTVVILTYNQERFVGQAIESAVGQVCDFPFEVLVVDDCSTDGTAEVCRRYAERYPQTVKFVRNEKNKGLIDNYFDTLLSVETPYIADCAGDDYWCDPHKLQRQVDILEHNPEVVLVHADFVATMSGHVSGRNAGVLSKSHNGQLLTTMCTNCSIRRAVLLFLSALLVFAMTHFVEPICRMNAFSATRSMPVRISNWFFVVA